MEWAMQEYCSGSVLKLSFFMEWRLLFFDLKTSILTHFFRFGKSKILPNMQDLARFRAQNCSGVLAGANFIALRRASFHFTWLVERYACRVIPLPGWLDQFVATIVFGASVSFVGGYFWFSWDFWIWPSWRINLKLFRNAGFTATCPVWLGQA